MTSASVISFQSECIGKIADALRKTRAGNELDDSHGTLVVGRRKCCRAHRQVLRARVKTVANRVADSDIQQVRPHQMVKGAHRGGCLQRHPLRHCCSIPPPITMSDAEDQHVELLDGANMRANEVDYVRRW